MQKVENYKDAIKVAIPAFIAIGLLVVEKDLGSALIFFGIFITMLYIGTSNLKYVLTGVILFFCGGIMSYYMFAHVRVRVKYGLIPLNIKQVSEIRYVNPYLQSHQEDYSELGLGLECPINTTCA